jgi:ABC-type polysaccharide/polyol phosphate export permease
VVDSSFFHDFKNSLARINVAYIFAWYDIKLRYRRTKLGLIWISLTVLIESMILSVLFSNLFHEPFLSYYPYVFSGRVIWQLIAGFLNESILAIPSAKNYILNHNIPPPVFIMRIGLRNVLIFFHSSLFVFAICAFNYQSYWSYFNIFLIPVMALLIVIMLFPFALILALLGARFRDIIFLMPYCMQILFYLTPIVWKSTSLSSKYSFYLAFNPITPMLELLRSIFLNQNIPYANLVPLLGLSLLGWLTASVIYGFSSKKLCYWML